MKIFYTYLHCKPDGTPFYVGKGTNGGCNSKRSHELYKDRNNLHRNIVNKYGKENILIYVFICESEKQALEDEIKQISYLRSCGYNLCNMTKGGDGVCGRVVSEETKKKISDSRIGMKSSDETKRKQSEWHKGKIVSEATRKKLSDSLKNYWDKKRIASARN